MKILNLWKTIIPGAISSFAVFFSSDFQLEKNACCGPFFAAGFFAGSGSGSGSEGCESCFFAAAGFFANIEAVEICFVFAELGAGVGVALGPALEVGAATAGLLLAAWTTGARPTRG